MFPHTWVICDVATILLRDNKMVHWRKSVQAISTPLTFNIASAISKQRHSILDVFEPLSLGWLFSVAVTVDSIMYSSWPEVPMTQSVYCFMTYQRIWWFRNLLINPTHSITIQQIKVLVVLIGCILSKKKKKNNINSIYFGNVSIYI